MLNSAKGGKNIMKIPVGFENFDEIRRKQSYYVDKEAFSNNVTRRLKYIK